jgi:signal transduction histidine kinase
VGDKVWISTGTKSQDGRQWGFVRVADNGPGIPKDHLQHLFERFYRVDEARTRDDADESPEQQDNQGTSGTGLGLAIVDGIAKSLGGGISVQSQPGKGSVFEVHVPLAPVSETASAKIEKFH